MFIDGFGISFYRSFGNEVQLIGPCNKINFFIGQNNSGKSNVLRFLKDRFKDTQLSARNPQNNFRFSEFEKHFGKNMGNLKIAFGLKQNNLTFTKIFKNKNIPTENNHVANLINFLLNFPELTRETDIAWFVYEQHANDNLVLSDNLLTEIASHRLINGPSSAEGLTDRDWPSLLSSLDRRSSTGYGEAMVKNAAQYILNSLSPATIDVPEITLIEAIREIKRDASQQNFNFNGLNIN